VSQEIYPRSNTNADLATQTDPSKVPLADIGDCAGWPSGSIAQMGYVILNLGPEPADSIVWNVTMDANIKWTSYVLTREGGVVDPSDVCTLSTCVVPTIDTDFTSKYGQARGNLLVLEGETGPVMDLYGPVTDNNCILTCTYGSQLQPGGGFAVAMQGLVYNLTVTPTPAAYNWIAQVVSANPDTDTLNNIYNLKYTCIRVPNATLGEDPNKVVTTPTTVVVPAKNKGIAFFLMIFIPLVFLICCCIAAWAAGLCKRKRPPTEDDDTGAVDLPGKGAFGDD